ncbi:MAG TPA: peptidoglycan-binding domain-containing protein [Ramlibacter sp.]|nr:peptidoglycan-binding domain-containing protein [Ramlibacter sp.]
MSAAVLRLGDKGQAVKALQAALLERGFNPGLVDGEFGGGTQAAVMAFQRSEGLLADGIAGPRTQAALGLVDSPELPDVRGQMTV